MIHELDWRLSGIVACIFLTTLFFFFFPGLSIGATAFFVLALIIEFARNTLCRCPYYSTSIEA